MAQLSLNNGTRASATASGAATVFEEELAAGRVGGHAWQIWKGKGRRGPKSEEDTWARLRERGCSLPGYSQPCISEEEVPRFSVVYSGSVQPSPSGLILVLDPPHIDKSNRLETILGDSHIFQVRVADPAHERDKWKSSKASGSIENVAINLPSLVSKVKAQLLSIRLGDGEYGFVHFKTTKRDDVNALDRKTSYQFLDAEPDESTNAVESKHVKVKSILLAGFNRTEPYVGKKLKDFALDDLQTLREKARIPIPDSVTVVMVPDPSEKLPEGCIFFQREGFHNEFKDMEVLVLKNPAYRLNDCQKLRIVDADTYPELRGYSDVVIMSVHGSVRESERLGGGDYDGDRVLVIFDRKVVSEFTKGQRDIDKEHKEVTDAFITVTEKVSSIIRNPQSDAGYDELLRRNHQFWVDSQSSPLGIYDRFRSMALERRGIRAPFTVVFAQMQEKITDARKQGLLLKPEVYELHKDYWQNKSAPIWYKPDFDKIRAQHKKNRRWESRYTRFLTELVTQDNDRWEEGMPSAPETNIDNVIEKYISRETPLSSENSDFGTDFKLIQQRMRVLLRVWCENRPEGAEQSQLPFGKFPPSSYEVALSVAPKYHDWDRRVEFFRRWFESDPPQQQLRSIVFQGNGKDRLMKIKAAVLYCLCRKDAACPWEIAHESLEKVRAEFFPSKVVTNANMRNLRLKSKSA
ncbi:hypothetical protein HDU93_005211 [Gonapodya sp. JEL0774]|nr:hypothetical protein HDU93_005211 [Gonapodya sp. JEL0774]